MPTAEPTVEPTATNTPVPAATNTPVPTVTPTVEIVPTKSLEPTVNCTSPTPTITSTKKKKESTNNTNNKEEHSNTNNYNTNNLDYKSSINKEPHKQKEIIYTEEEIIPNNKASDSEDRSVYKFKIIKDTISDGIHIEYSIWILLLILLIIITIETIRKHNKK